MKKFMGIFFAISITTLLISISLFGQSENILKLDGLYATSLAMNYKNYGVEKLFDGNLKTAWHSMPNAGVNEGIMIRFGKKVYIDHINLKYFPGKKEYNKLKTVSVIGDGYDFGNVFIYAKKPLHIKKKVSYLYIKFEKLEAKLQRNKFFVKGGDSEITSLSYYSNLTKNKPIGIDEIELFGIKGKFTVVTPGVVEGTITASSTLKPEPAYKSLYCSDGRKYTAWVEGANNSGAGEYLVLSLRKSMKISGFSILNGMHMSAKHLADNARVKNFSFYTYNNFKSSHKKYITTGTLPMPRLGKRNDIRLNKAVRDKSFVFFIGSVYSGRRYKDCVISELNLINKNNKRFYIHSLNYEKDKRALLRQVKSSILNRIIDKSFVVLLSEPFFTGKFQFTFRSDSSFVIWKNETSYTGGNQVELKKVYDGFWNIKSLSKKKAVLQLLGKSTVIANKYIPYRGVKKNKRGGVFGDTVTIKNGKLFGRKIGLVRFEK